MKLMQNILHKIKPHFEKDGKLHALYPAYDAFETFLFVQMVHILRILLI